MKRFVPFSLFFLFIIWVIWQANSYGTNYLFEWVEHVPYKDKIGHFTLYGILAVFFDFGLNRVNWRVGRMSVSKAAILVLSFAILEEITQLWIPARNFDLYDGLADLIGILFSVYLVRWLVKNGTLSTWIKSIREPKILSI